MNIRIFLFPALCATLAVGCGKPQPMGGPPGDMPVLAVVALVRAADVEDTIRVIGQVEAAEQIQLLSEVDATLKETGVEDGAQVEKGQILYRFDDHSYLAALAQAEARLTLARSELDRARRLRADNTAPQAELDRAEAEFRAAEAAVTAARDTVEDTVVRAAFAGILEDRPVSRGQFCSRGTDLGRLVQMDPLDIVFEVPERDSAQIRHGQNITFRTDAAPETAIPGTVTYLAPGLHEASRTLRVKARVSNLEGRLRPGMFGRVAVSLGVRPGVIRIPETAVQFHGETAQVVVMNEDGKAEFRPVTPGRRGDAVVEIPSGLAPGEKVVLEGFQKMGPGSRIQISPKSAAHGVDLPADAPGGQAAAPTPAGT